MPQRLRERPAAAEAEHRAARHFDATRDQPGQDARQADHAAEQYQLVRPRDRSAADGDGTPVMSEARIPLSRQAAGP